MRLNHNAHNFTEQLTSYRVGSWTGTYVDYTLNSSAVLYDGQYSDAMNRFARLAGKPEDPVTDPNVAEFIDNAHTIQGIDSLAVCRNVIHARMTPEAVWPEIAPDIRANVGQLAIARFPDRQEVEFTELRPRGY